MKSIFLLCMVVPASGALPLVFEPNRGQADAEVRYVARGGGYTLSLMDDGAVMNLRGARPVEMRLAGAQKPLHMEGLEPTGGISNYFLGNDPKAWRTKIPHYRRVQYAGVYPGVDVTFYGNPQQLEYDFTVAAGADPNSISVVYEGADSLRVDGEGNLVIATAAGNLSQPRARVYQEIAGKRVDVAARYRLIGAEVKFEIAGYDRSKELVIDPIIFYSTYLGGAGTDQPTGIAVDSNGSVYVSGTTNSINFPTVRPFQAANGGGYQDGFVAKISADGFKLIYATYFGGSGNDDPFGIAVDSTGNAYLTGSTDSVNFPRVNALQPTYGGGFYDAFVVKVSSDGSALIYSTYLGGSDRDAGLGIAVDASGSAYLTGGTFSADFPLVNPFQAVFAGFEDVFVVRISADGKALLQSTYLGGTGDDLGHAIAIDAGGNVYVSGETASANFPTQNAFQAKYNSFVFGNNGFVTKLSPGGTTLIYSSYLGGSGLDRCVGIALDPAGDAYVTGSTTSPDFPTVNALQPSHSSTNASFVSKVSASGSTLLYSTYLNVPVYGIAVDSRGNAYIAGGSNAQGFPQVSAVQAGYGGGAADGFVAEISSKGTSLLFSTYLGGIGTDFATQIALDGTGNIYVAGTTQSSNFPTFLPLQASLQGSTNVSVTKIFPDASTLPAVSVTMTHAGNFNTGQNGATYTAIVSNAPNVGSTGGPLTVTESAPAGLAIVSMSGNGWNCFPSSCTRSDTLSSGTSYPPITITANIAANAPSSFTNRVTVSGSSAFSVANDVTSLGPLVVIDGPVAGATLSGTATVSGWAIDSGSSINTVAVAVDGVGVGTATYGISRPDVCNAYPGRPGCPNVGYSFQLNTATVGPGGHVITVSAADSDGNPDTGSASVSVMVSALPPTVTIDSPVAGATVSGSVNVSGWAIDNSSSVGSTVGGVQIRVDGTLVGNATYGASRPDVCNVLPARPGCPNVGFSFSLNTNLLTPGAHVITVTATDNDITPDSNLASVTINVVAIPPAVFIDSPISGSVLTGITVVSGWAVDTTAIGSVLVKVDGVLAGNATYGGSRPDVCNVYPGRPGCPNVGFSFQLNAALLTAGVHTIAMVATDTDGTPDMGSYSVSVIVPGPPNVFIDAPVAGSTLSGVATISGWAVDNASAVGTAISGVQVKVDGTVVGNATYGASRPDVCNVFRGRAGCPNVGFTFSLNTASLSGGNHVITVTATDSDGVPDMGSATVNVTVASVPPAIFIDSPTSGTVIMGPVTVSGWAIDTTAISAVQVKVDGTVVGNATYGVSRPDVCNVFPGRPGCPNVGFTYLLDTNKLSPGSHTLTATAIDTDGTPDSGSFNLAITVPTLPNVFIDAPVAGSNVSGNVTISGWAIDTSTAITTVQVKVDGVFVANASYGVSRPDVCNVFTGRPGCPNVGFTYQLNTSSLAAGSHTITIVATDADGAPDVGSASVIVTR